mmetsp:Transcript_18193/g.22263  ORF Transcript_18193/g.22263 Transcript_18193/m.22263 type:complete len:147 (-) Transcript_18193:541-981(-)
MVKTRSSSFAAAESDVTEERSSEPRTKRSKKDEKEVLDIGNGPDGNDDAILSVERYGDDNAPRYEDDEFDDGLINGDKDPLSTKKAKQIADKKKTHRCNQKKETKKGRHLELGIAERGDLSKMSKKVLVPTQSESSFGEQCLSTPA